MSLDEAMEMESPCLPGRTGAFTRGNEETQALSFSHSLSSM
jgi:hypothetical protein